MQKRKQTQYTLCITQRGRRCLISLPNPPTYRQKSILTNLPALWLELTLKASGHKRKRMGLPYITKLMIHCSKWMGILIMVLKREESVPLEEIIIYGWMEISNNPAHTILQYTIRANFLSKIWSLISFRRRSVFKPRNAF